MILEKNNVYNICSSLNSLQIFPETFFNISSGFRNFKESWCKRVNDHLLTFSGYNSETKLFTEKIY